MGGVKRGHGRRRADGKINNENGKERVTPAFSKRNNWWQVNHIAGYGDHPAVFPLCIARDHILSWSNPGDVVLDPFMGSGTTAVAALETGRKYIGFEISPEYTALANDRIQKYVQGGTL